MRTRGEIHFLHRVFQVAAGFGVELAVLSHLTRTHGGVGRVGRFPKTLQLDTMRRRPRPTSRRAVSGEVSLMMTMRYIRGQGSDGLQILRKIATVVVERELPLAPPRENFLVGTQWIRREFRSQYDVGV